MLMHRFERASGENRIDSLSADLAEEPRRQALRRPKLVLGAVVLLVAAAASFALSYGGFAPVTLIELGAVAFLSAGGVLVAASLWLALLQRRPRTLDVLSAAIETISSPRLILDPQGGTAYANDAFHRMFGCDRHGALSAMEAVFGADSEATSRIAAVRAAAAEGAPAQAELRVVDGQGNVEWRNVSARPLKSHQGYVLLQIDDTTARREMEQIVREEQDKLVDFLENAPVGFYSVDRHGRFIFVNQTLADWLGCSTEDILSSGDTLHDFLVIPDGRVGVAYDPFGGDGSRTSGEVTMRGAHGQTFQASINQSVIESERDGLRTRSVVRDLTPQRAWEKALRESEQQFQRIFEDAPVGIALVDLEGRVVQCNQAFRGMAAAEGGHLAGANLVDLVGDDEREEVVSRLEGTVAGEGSLGPAEVHPRARPDLTISLFMNAVTDGGGQVREIIAHCLDTTEQRNLEVQFAQSQKMQAVGQLAGGVAHDFNNLLTAMIGFCDLLLLRHKPGEQSFADIMQIKQNANRAASLVRQLLAFSRQQTLKPKVLDVTDVLAELGHLLRRLVGEAIDVRMVHGRDLGPVRVDQGQLEQVIINLVVNARDAMANGGVVTIRTGNVANDDPLRLGHEMLPPGEYVLIEIIDEGEGISKENIGRIFEPFFSTKEVGAGTGLGLSTVYGIVKQTGGFVFVESKKGHGATFKVFLPHHQASGETESEGAPAAAAEAPEDLTGAGTVLLVEDEDPVRLFSARALRNKGYTVLEAESGEAAMNVIVDDDRRIDLLITDVVMPRMDGPSLIREVRERRPEIKVICISGYAEDAFRKKLDQSSDIHFLPKPFSLNQLAGKVKEVMHVPTA